MNRENLILTLLDKLLWDNMISNISSENPESSESIYIWKYVILRCRNAGVHFWKLEYAKNWVYRLSDSRRLYYWNNIKGITLSETALYWLQDDSKVCATISLHEIMEKEWGEIIPCSDDSIKSIQWKNDYIS